MNDFITEPSLSFILYLETAHSNRIIEIIKNTSNEKMNDIAILIKTLIEINEMNMIDRLKLLDEIKESIKTLNRKYL
jgi:hypothetical protein